MTEIRLKSLPDTDDYWQYQFDDMVFRTESLSKSDRQRIIPLGQASGILMAYMARHRDLLQGKRVIEPFAGSGPLGLLALHLGAESAHFVDLNPRVSDFIHHNAVENGILDHRYAVHISDIEHFHLQKPFDWLFANPPFVPTPPKVPGVLHSAAGPDGNRLAEVLIRQIPQLLHTTGEALIYLLQLEVDGRPLASLACEEFLPDRSVEFTKGWQYQLPFESLVTAYRDQLPEQKSAIDEWSSSISEKWGEELIIDSYVIHIGPMGSQPGIRTRNYDGTKYGSGFFNSRDSLQEVVAENLI